MSEYINNNQQRVEQLYKFSMGIMEGKDGKTLINKYREAIENVTPHDIIRMEDKQVQEGVEPKLIKEHIEKIMNVLGSYLDKYKWVQPQKGHPLYYFQQENRELEKLLSCLKSLIIQLSKSEKEKEGVLDELQIKISKLKEFDKHYLRKENILFPYLEKKWEEYRPLQVMWSLHDDIRKVWKELPSSIEKSDNLSGEACKKLGELFMLMYRMIFKEEKIIFPVAMETLTEKEWQEIQKLSLEMGYAYIGEPDNKIISAKVKNKNEVGSEDNMDDISLNGVTLGMGTGVLSLEQLIMMLNTLPVDITFVDENDRVRYFSNPEERFFPRSPAIIGRTVQNCHPPESVHIVEKILDSFKSGEKDKARFWIQMKGRFVMIEYFAMRDSSGNYKGTLEVGQDITDIRKLDGEQRLLDWD